MILDSTICAISSPAGVGAISIVRLSGPKSIDIAGKIVSNSTYFNKIEANKIVFSKIMTESSEVLDEVMISKFLAPKSFTGENMVEIFCHGSQYIQNEIVSLLIEKGASVAKPGEFTQRAFLNGKLDLSQSEAVADLISSSNAEYHKIAMNQMKGHVSDEIKQLRMKMIELVSLLELELDFGEEDVEFADRTQLKELTESLLIRIGKLAESFKYGNAVKNGVPVTIAGAPNSGKSTLLNALVQEERAIVSSIPGTTRDTIEEELIIDGISFRLTDTAGIRKSEDEIEKIGIERAYSKINKASLVVLLLDSNVEIGENKQIIHNIQSEITQDQKLIIVFNKIDKISKENAKLMSEIDGAIGISAKFKKDIENLLTQMTDYVFSLKTLETNVIISSVRHYEMLVKSVESLQIAAKALEDNLSGDFVSQDLREAMFFLGEITGDISNEEVLGAIFSKFCIGK